MLYFEKERQKMQRQMSQDPYLDTALRGTPLPPEDDGADDSGDGWDDARAVNDERNGSHDPFDTDGGRA